MSVRSKRLFAPTTVGTTVTGLYTAPADTTGVVKTLGVVNTTVLELTVSLYVGGTAAANRITVLTVPASRGLLLENLFMVFADGETLRANSGASGGAILTGFGAELLGVA